MNKEKLKRLIEQVILENREKTVLLSSPLNEATTWTQYGRVMDMFAGDVESVDQLVIMTPENPHAKPLSKEQNAARIKVFKQEMASAGYGYRKVEGMYEGPEDSFVIPHMSEKDAARFCYKYGQESFVYSVKQEGAEAKMLHKLVVINYDKPEQDPAYPIEEYGPVYIIPSQVSTTVDAEATKVLNMQDLHKAPDYYFCIKHQITTQTFPAIQKEQDFQWIFMVIKKKELLLVLQGTLATFVKEHLWGF
jgi:hypothetical protein